MELKKGQKGAAQIPKCFPVSQTKVSLVTNNICELAGIAQSLHDGPSQYLKGKSLSNLELAQGTRGVIGHAKNICPPLLNLLTIEKP